MLLKLQLGNQKDCLMKSIKPPSTFDNNLNSGINSINNDNIQVKFKGNCLKEEKLIFKATSILYCL